MNTTCGKDQNPTGVADGKESQGTLQETNWNCLAGQSPAMSPWRAPRCPFKANSQEKGTLFVTGIFHIHANRHLAKMQPTSRTSLDTQALSPQGRNSRGQAKLSERHLLCETQLHTAVQR